MKTLALLVLANGVLAAAGQTPKQDRTEVSRLVDLARVWVTADYFHPYLASRDIDWDSALVNAIPQVRKAKRVDELLTAYVGMLSVLGDPLTIPSVAAAPPTALDADPSEKQRSRIHRGLARDDGQPSAFSSGFLMIDEPTVPRVCALDLTEGIHVQIRLSEPVAKAPSDSYKRKRARPEEAFPSQELRILAAFRLWGAVRYFFAYKDLMDEDWDAVFTEYLPKIVAARDARDYHLTVAELVSHLSDSNAIAQSPTLAEYFGERAPAVRVRLIERKPTIVSTEQSALESGAKIGDVITKVDSESSGDRIKRIANYLSASTPAGLSDLVSRLFLNAGNDSPARITVARAGGLDADLSLQRSVMSTEAAGRPAASAERQLPGGIGYIDLDRMDDTQWDSLYTRFERTAALILDLRGRCNVSLDRLIAPFPDGAGRQASVITGPLALQPDLPSATIETATSSYFQIMRVPAPHTKRPAYRGKVVALIDERTRGQAEVAALVLAAAAHVQFVGSPTSGAPSDATQLTLPGRISLSFSAQDVRLTNGGPLQRQGIQPALTAPVTLAGVRAGRDQPLDVALAWLKEELGSGAAVLD